MDLHHQLDQSYRIPRRAQAQRTQLRTQALLRFGHLEPAQLLAAPTTLMGEDQPVSARIMSSYSQEAALAQSGTVGVLIFGSATKPGGGWLNGAKAQEEDISLASTWGTQAALAPEGFYGRYKGLGGLGPDQALLAPGFWLADPYGIELPAPLPVVFAGVAAPNLENLEIAALPLSELIDHLARRLAAALIGWRQAGVHTVVMGAIGCGVFQWKPEDSARALRKAVNHVRSTGNALPEIVLALPDPRFESNFADVLLKPRAA